MDEARMNTLITEIQTLEDEFLNHRPDDADMDYVLPRFIKWSLLSHELLTLRLADLRERMSRIESLINHPASTDTTELPPAQP